MTIDPALLEATIREMLAAIPAAHSAAPAAPQGDGIFADMDDAVAAAVAAAAAYRSCTMADRRRFVAAIREAMLAPENLDYMASQAVLDHPELARRMAGVDHDAARRGPGATAVLVDRVADAVVGRELLP